MDSIHIDEGVLKVIRAGADVEETSRKLCWLRGCIERAMIG